MGDLNALMAKGKAEGKILDYVGVLVGNAAKYYVSSGDLLWTDFHLEFEALAQQLRCGAFIEYVDTSQLALLKSEVVNFV